MQSSVVPIVNFPQIEVPEVKSPWANALKNALGTYSNLQGIESKKYENLINQAKAQYAQPMAAAELSKAQAEPDYIRAQTVYQKALSEGVPSEIALRIAQTNSMNKGLPSEISLRNAQAEETQQNTAKQKALLPYVGQTAQADIEEKKAMANYYLQGGGRVGTANAAENTLEQSILADNPNVTDPNKKRELINTVLSGGTQLSDGTPINTMSPITRNKYDAAAKARTTAQAINQNLQANQAEAELPIYKRYIDEGVKPYGTTVFNKSPLQVKDALDVHNPEAQQRLGKYLAAQQLQYDRAALMLKINALPPGQKIATKIATLASQTIDAKYPTLSNEARQVASDTVAKALEEGLKARNEYGISISKSLAPEKSSSAITTKWVRKNGQLVRED